MYYSRCWLIFHAIKSLDFYFWKAYWFVWDLVKIHIFGLLSLKDFFNENSFFLGLIFWVESKSSPSFHKKIDFLYHDWGSWIMNKRWSKRRSKLFICLVFKFLYMLEFKISYSMTIVWDFLICLFPFAPKITFKSI